MNNLNEKKLKKSVYLYYPRGINAVINKNEYLISKEFIALSKQIELFKSDYEAGSFNDFINKLTKNIHNKKFINATLFDWQDRCFNFQFYFINNNKIQSICLNISFLIPYYTIYLLNVNLDNKTNQWLNLPERIFDIKNEMNNEIEKLKLITENHLNYKLFDQKLESKIIEDISFQDIQNGEFTFFNAFFLNEYNIRV